MAEGEISPKGSQKYIKNEPVHDSVVRISTEASCQTEYIKYNVFKC